MALPSAQQVTDVRRRAIIKANLQARRLWGPQGVAMFSPLRDPAEQFRVGNLKGAGAFGRKFFAKGVGRSFKDAFAMAKIHNFRLR